MLLLILIAVLLGIAVWRAIITSLSIELLLVIVIVAVGIAIFRAIKNNTALGEKIKSGFLSAYSAHPARTMIILMAVFALAIAIPMILSDAVQQEQTALQEQQESPETFEGFRADDVETFLQTVSEGEGIEPFTSFRFMMDSSVSGYLAETRTGVGIIINTEHGGGISHIQLYCQPEGDDQDIPAEFYAYTTALTFMFEPDEGNRQDIISALNSGDRTISLPGAEMEIEINALGCTCDVTPAP